MSTANKIGKKIPILKRVFVENGNLKTDRGVLQLEKGQLEADIRELQDVADNPRNFLAQHYLKGKGIEIGAAHFPVKIPDNASVKYVDVFTADELREKLPREYAKAPLVEIDVVDDGEKLAKFRNSSLDFIIANHFLEHCLDPIGTILNMYAKLRKEGVLYMAVPDKRYTFDVKRPLTSYKHLLEEHKDKTNGKFRLEHTQEAVRLTERNKGRADIEKKVRELMASDFRIHYHVWTQKELTDMFARMAQDFSINLEIEAVLKNRHEVIYILKKEPPRKLKPA